MNGDIVTLDHNKIECKLFDAQDVTSTGVWVEGQGGYPWRSFWADAIEGGGTIDIMVSNAPTKPANNVAGPIIGTLTPTVLALAPTSSPFRWVKANKTAGGSPAVSTVIGRFERP